MIVQPDTQLSRGNLEKLYWCWKQQTCYYVNPCISFKFVLGCFKFGAFEGDSEATLPIRNGNSQNVGNCTAMTASHCSIDPPRLSPGRAQGNGLVPSVAGKVDAGQRRPLSYRKITTNDRILHIPSSSFSVWSSGPVTAFHFESVQLWSLK